MPECYLHPSEAERIAELEQALQRAKDGLSLEDLALHNAEDALDKAKKDNEKLLNQIAELEKALQHAEHPAHQLFELKPTLGAEVAEEGCADGEGVAVQSVPVRVDRPSSVQIFGILEV